jgi:hypothetical protein
VRADVLMILALPVLAAAAALAVLGAGMGQPGLLRWGWYLAGVAAVMQAEAWARRGR